jgi:hypothetical protein
MNWNEFRKSYSQKYGSTTRQNLAQEYALYKQKSPQRFTIKKTVSSPHRVKSPKRFMAKKSAVSPKRVVSPKKLVIKKTVITPRRQSLPIKGKMTLNDFNQMAQGKKFLIVVIYANRCSHCQDMKKRLGSKMKNTDKIVFYEEKQLDDSLKKFFPHVLYYQDGKKQSDLTVDDVYTYLHV